MVQNAIQHDRDLNLVLKNFHSLVEVFVRGDDEREFFISLA